MSKNNNTQGRNNPDNKNRIVLSTRELRKFASKYLAKASMRAILDGLLTEDEDNIEIWAKNNIPTACTYYDHKEKKHVIFVGATLEGFENVEKDEDILHLVFSLLVHEVGHIFYTTRQMKELNRILKENQIPFEIFNLFEDARIEHLLREELSATANLPFFFNWEKWFGKVSEHPAMSPESIFYSILNMENKRSIMAAKYPAVLSFYNRVIAASNSFDVIDILIDWKNHFYPNQNQQQQGQQQSGGQQNQQQQGQQSNDDGSQSSGMDGAVQSLIEDIKNGTVGKPKKDNDFDSEPENDNESSNSMGNILDGEEGDKWGQGGDDDAEDEEEGQGFFNESFDDVDGQEEEEGEQQEEENRNDAKQTDGVSGTDQDPRLAHLTDLKEMELRYSDSPEQQHMIIEEKSSSMPVNAPADVMQQYMTPPQFIRGGPRGGTLDSVSTTKDIFRKVDKNSIFLDPKLANALVKIVEKLNEDVRGGKRNTTKPRGNFRNKTLATFYANPGTTKAYRRKRIGKNPIEKTKIALILDTSGSMYGYPEHAQRHIMYALNRLAKNLPQAQIDVIATMYSSANVFQTVRLPVDDEMLLGVTANGGSMMIPSLVQNKEILEKKDAVIFVTDGELLESDKLSRDNISPYIGEKTISIGYYPGTKAEMYYNRDMENWFDLFLLGTNIESAFNEMVDFLNDSGEKVKRRHAQGKQGKNDQSRLVEVDDVDTDIYQNGRGPHR